MRVAILVICAFPLLAEFPACPSAAVQWSPCEIRFDSSPADVEFRSPKKKTLLLPTFREGGKTVVRFTPTEDGVWDFKAGEATGQFSAASSNAPGFIHPINAHHWIADNDKQHLWMGTRIDLRQPRAEFDQEVALRAKEKFTHLTVVLGKSADLVEAADRVWQIHKAGMTTDLALEELPSARDVTGLVARFAAFNLTWAGVVDFEKIDRSKSALKEYGLALRRVDPYQHPRGSLAEVTSASLTGDQWMNYFSYGTSDPNIGAVEHQVYQIPALATKIQTRQELWNATMNGQYPASGSGPHMKAWFEFMNGNRYWELEPYFDLEGGRALALDGIEYIVYLEKPGPVTVTVESHGYDVAWINPATGERVKAKDFKGTMFTGEPPTKDHDWVLHISREGTKQGMLKSYKFASRDVPVQQVESDPSKVPFEVVAPAEGDISMSKPPAFSIRTKRDTRAFRNYLVEWNGEVAVEGQGYRVIGTGRDGTFRIPSNIVSKFPAVMTVRITILNAAGKAYQIDRAYRLVP